MKLHFLRIAIGVFFVLFTTQIIKAQNTFEGDYLGKKLPGLTRELFDQGEVGGKMAFNFSFSPDGQELFFSYRKGTEENPYPWYEIKYMKQIDGVWSKAKTAFFSGKNSDVDITFSPDGKRLFFISDRHNPDEDADVYYLDKTEDGWSQPIPIEGEVNSPDGDEMHASISRNGTLVFRSTRPGGYGGADLYLADYVDGKFVNVRNMGSHINTAQLESDCFIAQDGSYIVYNAIREVNNNKPQIFVTFSLGNGDWSRGIPLSDEVNSKDGTIGSTISPDGKYLFYSARYGKLRGKFWISTDVIKKLNPNKKYLGQKPPGNTPKVFAPGIISTEKNELNSVFSPEDDEFYYSIYTRDDGKYTIWYSRMINGVWTKPEIVPFSGEYSDVDMAFSPDGKRLYFCSKRPVPGNSKPEYYIWYCERNEEKTWSDPIMLEFPVNTPFSETYPTFTSNGRMYLASNRDGTIGSKDVYSIDFIDGKFTNAVNLGDSINTKYGEGDTFIAPDESFMIISCWGRPEGKGMDISFRKDDGTWTKKTSIEKALGWKTVGGCPYVSPDGKYFFFTCRGDIYWVDAKFINDLKTKILK